MHGRVVTGMISCTVLCHSRTQTSCACTQASVEPAGALKEAVAAEALFQLKEFMGDFNGHDIARLVCGVADFKAPVSADLQGAIMKVRPSLRTCTAAQVRCTFGCILV